MGTDTLSATACPHCGATVRPGAPYCSLCHTDFRPPPPVVEQPAPVAQQPILTPGRPAGEVDPLTAPLLDVVLPPEASEGATVPQQHAPAVPVPGAEPRWPCHACGASNPFSTTVCGGCGSGFLAGASEKISLVVPGVGDVMGLSRGQRILLALGGAVLIGMVPVVIGLLVKAVS